jgi:hypothetical protein
MPSDGKSSHGLRPGELKMFILYTSVDTETTCIAFYDMEEILREMKEKSMETID